MTIKIGVIGCGNMGRNHIRVINNLINVFHLVGVYDKNPANSIKIRDIYGTTVYENAEHLIDTVDAVVVATPSVTHEYYGMLCLNKKKDVLIEKPIATTAESAFKLVKLSDTHKTVLMTGHIELYNPVMNEVKNILSHEEIISLDYHRLSPFDDRISDVDVVKDLMVHDVYNVQYLLGNDISKLYSTGAKIYSDKYDYAQTLLRFQSGILASLTASRVTEGKKRVLDINTKNAYICVDFINKTIEISRKTKYKLDVGYNTEYIQENIIEKVLVTMKEPLYAELEHFGNCIMTRQKPLTCGKSGYIAIQLCENIIDAIGE